jgi:carbamate kinase
MAGSAIVALAGGGDLWPDVAAVAGSVRALVQSGWGIVLVAPPSSPAVDAASQLVLGLGQSPAGRRAVPVVAHVLVDPADPALARPPGSARAEPLAILEAEAIAALVGSGFPVVVSGRVPVVPAGDARGSGGVPRDARGSGGVPRDARGSGGVPRDEYRPVAADIDRAASARRLAGDLGAGVLAFVTPDDQPLPGGGEIDVVEAERLMAEEPRLTAELGAAVGFLRAGGELAVIGPAARLPGVLAGNDAGPGLLRIRRTVARPRSEAPALAAGWC